jgi:hypothetical protein
MLALIIGENRLQIVMAPQGNRHKANGTERKHIQEKAGRGSRRLNLPLSCVHLRRCYAD